MPIYAWTGTSESVGNTTQYNFGGNLSGTSERIGNTIHYRLSDGSTGIIEVDGDTFRYNLGNGNTGISQTIGNTTQYNFSGGLSGISENIGGTVHYNFSDGTNGIGETIGNTTHFNFTEPISLPTLNPLPSPNYINTRKFNYDLPATDVYSPPVITNQNPKPVDLQRFKIAQTGFDVCYPTLSSECPTLLSYFNERTNSYQKYPNSSSGGYSALTECIKSRAGEPDYNKFSNNISDCSNAIKDDYELAKEKGCFDALNKCYELRIKCPIGAAFITTSGECSCGFGEVLNEAGTACVYYQKVSSVNPVEEKTLPSCPPNSTLDATNSSCSCNTGFALYEPQKKCVSVPKNAHVVETEAAAWLCNEGYKEKDGQCELKTDPRLAAIKAIYIQEVLAKSDSPKEDSNISTQQESINSQKPAPAPASATVMNNKKFILFAVIIISVIGIGIFIYKMKK